MSADTTDEPTPVAELGYEQARDELVEVVRLLELGGLDLDSSLNLWERGEALARRCEEHLEGARARIEATLNADSADGDISDDDIDPDA
ncbi:exodeoxyribonuclease VII small subunit [Williamsia sterculiae]|uniref:Exodeoxyribonuclease 7 small subunit n=1 Tax=Williamsia sterculiae TaxID=1344003 RepID=A0A1N7DSR8_9NOCA|nr:exodeoxyribonuclease VII small subunit [Williamsia sterculiae]SIR78933.1 Exodeoxyribonuclease VII small subunit [Williamsia sterculiae]